MRLYAAPLSRVASGTVPERVWQFRIPASFELFWKLAKKCHAGIFALQFIPRRDIYNKQDTVKSSLYY